MLHVLPVATYILVQGHRLPIDRDDLALRRITDSRHLEWEQREAARATRDLLLVHIRRPARLLVDGNRVVVGDELAVEAAHNEQFSAAQLSHAYALTRRDGRQQVRTLGPHVQHLPVVRLVGYVKDESLNVRAILLVGIGDAAEDEQELVIEMAAGVIMTALVNLCNFHPLVELRVVNLDLLSGSVDLLARARHDDVAVLDGTARVTVARVPHTLLLDELQVVFLRVVLLSNLTALEHTLRQRLEVATADHEYTWHLDADLNHLEIVREVSSMLDELVAHLLGHRIVRRHGLGVLLEHVYQMRKLDCDGQHVHLCLGELGTHSLSASILLLKLLSSLLVSVDTAVEFATLGCHLERVLALSHVLDDLALHEGLAAAGTHDF